MTSAGVVLGVTVSVRTSIKPHRPHPSLTPRRHDPAGQRPASRLCRGPGLPGTPLKRGEPLCRGPDPRGATKTPTTQDRRRSCWCPPSDGSHGSVTVRPGYRRAGTAPERDTRLFRRVANSIAYKSTDIPFCSCLRRTGTAASPSIRLGLDCACRFSDDDGGRGCDENVLRGLARQLCGE